METGTRHWIGLVSKMDTDSFACIQNRHYWRWHQKADTQIFGPAFKYTAIENQNPHPASDRRAWTKLYQGNPDTLHTSAEDEDLSLAGYFNGRKCHHGF